MIDQTIEISPKSIDTYALYVKHGNYSQVARLLNVEPTTVMYHVRKVREANADGVSLVDHARHDIVNNALPKAIDIYDKALDNYDKKPDLAVNVATNVLKGTQVLVPKTQEDKTTKRLELIVKAEATANKLELVDLLGLEATEADYEVIDTDTTTDPPPQGSDTKATEVDDS